MAAARGEEGGERNERAAGREKGARRVTRRRSPRQRERGWIGVERRVSVSKKKGRSDGAMQHSHCLLHGRSRRESAASRRRRVSASTWRRRHHAELTGRTLAGEGRARHGTAAAAVGERGRGTAASKRAHRRGRVGHAGSGRGRIGHSHRRGAGRSASSGCEWRRRIGHAHAHGRLLRHAGGRGTAATSSVVDRRTSAHGKHHLASSAAHSANRTAQTKRSSAKCSNAN